MLLNLHVKNLAVIDEIDLNFQTDLTYLQERQVPENLLL